MFKLRIGRPGKNPMMFALAWAGAGPLGVPFTLVPFEDSRPPGTRRRAARASSAAAGATVKARRTEGESGAGPAPGPGRPASRGKWR